MTTNDFLSLLSARLVDLPPDEIDRSLAYYRELIGEHIDEGMSEAQAVDVMGSPDEIVAQIVTATPLPTAGAVSPSPAPQRAGIGRRLLLILGAPLWLPLLIAAAAVALAVWLTLWALLATLYAVDLSLAAGAVTGVAGFAALLATGSPAPGAAFLGAGLFCAGGAILLFYGCLAATKGLARASRQGFDRMKTRLLRRGNAA